MIHMKCKILSLKFNIMSAIFGHKQSFAFK